MESTQLAFWRLSCGEIEEWQDLPALRTDAGTSPLTVFEVVSPAGSGFASDRFRSWRVLFPATGFGTADLAEYYRKVARKLLPHLKNVPVSFRRFPDAVDGQAFWEKDKPSFALSWVKTLRVPRKSGESDIHYVLVNDVKTLVWIAEAGGIEIHPFLSRAPNMAVATGMIFDLDPGPDTDIVDCCRVALLLREALQQLNLQSLPKVSGSKGLQREHSDNRRRPGSGVHRGRKQVTHVRNPFQCRLRCEEQSLGIRLLNFFPRYAAAEHSRSSCRAASRGALEGVASSATNVSMEALWLEDFVWRDGLLLGSQRPVEMGGRRHFHLDHLGTPRLITADNGQRISSHDYYPFGDEYSPFSQETAAGFDREEPMKFTGHERDYAGGMGAEDGHAIDYMHARYYNPSPGRFLSVDPLLGGFGEPQSWNRYTYALNNPLGLLDPFGLAARKPGEQVQKGDTCDGAVVDGWCTAGEIITVEGTQPKTEEVTPPPLSWANTQPIDLSKTFAPLRNTAQTLRYLTPDDFRLKHAPEVDFGQCIEDNSFSNVYTFAAHSANAALNVAVGSTGRVGVGGVLPHATTWEHKALSGFGGNASRVGRFAGRAAIALTIFEGFYDIGTIGRCGAIAASR